VLFWGQRGKSNPQQTAKLCIDIVGIAKEITKPERPEAHIFRPDRLFCAQFFVRRSSFISTAESGFIHSSGIGDPLSLV
jgi:hypothetical protein